jgi:outer membrane protein assembly factor BamD
MGTRFRKQEGEAYSRIVKDYPLSEFADNAKKKLQELEMPIPQADQVAMDRMKWERENRQKAGMLSRSTSILKRGPDMSTAARSGNPAMTTLRPSVPPAVPQLTPGSGVGNDVTVAQGGDTTALDKNPDARANPPAAGGATPAAPGATAPPAAAPDAKATDGTSTSSSSAQTSSSSSSSDQPKGKKKKKDKKQTQPAAQPAATTQPPPANPSTPPTKP